jgi:hypothetical protein
MEWRRLRLHAAPCLEWSTLRAAVERPTGRRYGRTRAAPDTTKRPTRLRFRVERRRRGIAFEAPARDERQARNASAGWRPLLPAVVPMTGSATVARCRGEKAAGRSPSPSHEQTLLGTVSLAAPRIGIPGILHVRRVLSHLLAAGLVASPAGSGPRLMARWRRLLGDARRRWRAVQRDDPVLGTGPRRPGCTLLWRIRQALVAVDRRAARAVVAAHARPRSANSCATPGRASCNARSDPRGRLHWTRGSLLRALPRTGLLPLARSVVRLPELERRISMSVSHAPLECL